ncbi:MAG: insulinase family protein [Lysobacter sp.]|nr:insulinase family protein [Lysobacter sp.]
MDASDAASASPPSRDSDGWQAHRLANGMNVLHLPMRTAPVALLMLTYDVGSRHETDGVRGVSHMLEHMMFKGSAAFDPRRGNGILDLLLPLGAQANATTWYDRTHYFSLVPRDSLELAAQIEADRMSHLNLDPAQLETEKAVVLNEFDRHLGDPVELLHQAVWRTAFARHGYGVPVLGVREDIAGFQRDHLHAHYRRHYRPDNATLTVLGDVGRDEAWALAERHFGAVPARPQAAFAEAPEPEQEGERRTVIESAGAPGIVMLAYRTPAGVDPDLDALEVLGLVLAGGRASRLHRRLIAAGLATEVWPSLARLRCPGLLQLGAVVHPECEHAQVEQALRAALDELRRDGVGDEEVARAKARIRGSLLTSRDGPLAVAMQLNEAIACGDWRGYAAAADRIAAVSAADVERVAQRYLSDRGLTVAYLVDAYDPRTRHAQAVPA